MKQPVKSFTNKMRFCLDWKKRILLMTVLAIPGIITLAMNQEGGKDIISLIELTKVQC